MSANQGQVVHVNGNPVQPASQKEGGELFKPNASESDFILLQTKAPIDNAQLLELDKIQVQVNQRVGVLTYLCRYEPQNLTAVRELPWIVYANVYHPDLVVQADLKQKLEEQPSAAKDVLHEVDLLIHLGSMVTLDQVIDLIVKQVGIPRETLEKKGETCIHARLSRADLDKVAKVDHVQSISMLYQPRLDNDMANMIIGRDDLVKAGVQVSAKDQIITVADTGLDIGQQGFGPTKKVGKDIHPAFRGRIKGLFSITRYHPDPQKHPKNVEGATDDPQGHGTHVAGTVLGKFTVKYTPEPPPDVKGFSKPVGPVKPPAPPQPVTLRLDGVAPDASLYFQSLGKWQKSQGGTDFFNIVENINMEYLLETAYTAGSRVHCNSWSSGAPSSVGYDQFATEVDRKVRKYPDLIVIRAAGNSGDYAVNKDYKPSMTSYAMARNGITVGAVFNTRKVRYSGLPLYAATAEKETSPFDVPMFSARGDPKQGAIKPDLVAPGVAILSAQSQMPEAIEHSRDGILKASWAPTSECKYDTGTSMAAPVVAGAAACVRQALTDLSGGKNAVSPSANLIRVILINTAIDLSMVGGKLAAGCKVTEANNGDFSGNPEKKLEPAPNGVQGWGCLNLKVALNSIKALNVAKSTTSKLFGIWEIREDVPASVTDVNKLPFRFPVPQDKNWRSLEIVVPNDKKYALHAHLVYTDFPGKLLTNRLHLHVVSGNKTINLSTTSETYKVQHLSNTKGMVIEPMLAGNVTIYVVAELVAKESVPGSKVEQANPVGFAVAWRLREA